MKRVELVLPLPPSVNSYWRSVTTREGKSKVLISKEGRAWKKRALLMVKMQKPTLIGGELEVTVVWYFRRRGSDVDNPTKPLLDLLQFAKVFENDVLIVDLHLHKRYDSGNPRCVVTIEPAASAEHPEQQPFAA